MSDIAGIILAAGKGKRMGLENVNKVTLPIADKPIILHIVHFLKSLEISSIVVVVGHAKESVRDVLASENVLYAEQKEQLGTGHALQVALSKLQENITDVLMVYGDDAVLYRDDQQSLIQSLLAKHTHTNAAITMLTIELDDPTGMGRIVRDEDGRVNQIVEEKDANSDQLAIKEINPGCFVFNIAFLKNYLHRLEKSLVTGEFYVTSLVDLALANNKKVEAVQAGKVKWRGVNTPEELDVANRLI